MTTIDEARLESDLAYRFDYLCGFLGFGGEDRAAIRAVSAHMLPLVPQFVRGIYVKLLDDTATRRHFLPRQSGYGGELPQSVDELSLTHPVIELRRAHLAQYLMRLFDASFDVALLDFVGMVHTNRVGNSELQVPLVQMNAMLGLLADAILATVLELKIDPDTRHRAARAFGKLLWLQNDLINRNYRGEESVAPASSTA